MPELLKPDICVIGAGAGGLSVAAAAAAFGVPVVLVEKGEMGGDCLNTGCVPSKSLIAAAKHARAIARAASFGVSGDRPEVDFGNIHKSRARRHRGDRAERFQGAVRRPRRAGDRRLRTFQELKDRNRRRGDRDQGAALRDRDRVVAVVAADSRARDDAAPHQRDGVRAHRAARASRGDRRRADRARACASLSSAWRRR